MIMCAGRSGSTMYYRVIARHREVGFLSSWHQKFPRLTWLAISSRLYGMRPFNRVRHNSWFPKPFAPYAFWDRYVPGIARHDRPLVSEDVPNESIEPLRRAIAQVLKYQGATRFLMKVTGWARMACFDRVFPDMMFVHLRRRPISVVASWLKAGWLNVAGDIDSANWEWGEVPEPYRRIYRDLGGRPVLAAAIKTQLDIDDIRRNIAMFPGRCYELNYEDLVVDPHRYFRETLEFCELAWDDDMTRVIETAGIRNCSDRWKQQIPGEDARVILEFFDRVKALPAAVPPASRGPRHSPITPPREVL